MTETILLLLIRVHVISRITGQLSPTSKVLSDCHGSLFQIQEFSALQFDLSRRYMMVAEGSLEVCPTDVVGVVMCSCECGPPICCCSCQLVRGVKDSLSSTTLGDLQLALNVLQPVIGIKWLHSISEGGRLSAEKVTKLGLGWWWWRLVRWVSLLVLLEVVDCCDQSLQYLHRGNLSRIHLWLVWGRTALTILSAGVARTRNSP